MAHTVLLVDDEPHLLAGLQRVLRKEPYTVISATSARDGWVILQGRLIDVVVSDHDMPDIPGTAFLAQVHRAFPDTIRFMLTGKATLEVAIQAINNGAISRFFTKPYNHADLASSIQKSLQQKDLLREARRLAPLLRQRSRTLQDLERHYPGLTTVQRDQSGAIIASREDVPIEAIVRHLRRTASQSALSS